MPAPWCAGLPQCSECSDSFHGQRTLLRNQDARWWSEAKHVNLERSFTNEQLKPAATAVGFKSWRSASDGRKDPTMIQLPSGPCERFWRIALQHGSDFGLSPFLVNPLVMPARFKRASRPCLWHCGHTRARTGGRSARWTELRESFRALSSPGGCAQGDTLM